MSKKKKHVRREAEEREQRSQTERATAERGEKRFKQGSIALAILAFGGYVG